jgi:ubiquinone/menaquinone biosynthesis C-methylase UbiE
MPRSDSLLDEQLAYYRARASEYDESIQQESNHEADKEWQQIVRSLDALGPLESVLELACGTGLWTQELVKIGKNVVAIDGAPEMLAVNRAKVSSDRVRYQQADLFHWKADAQFDLVFFAFWISHVPPDRTAMFLAEVAKAIRPGGRVLIVDEPAGGRQLSGPIEGNNQQKRVLQDGRKYKIVKIYHQPHALAEQLQGLGFTDVEVNIGDFFFTINAGRD